ncbi:LysE family translocator [Pseudomonas mucidolens]|uniref:Threonine/homoserine/homoserine lactone efflux protein n=1 Tax=Pseudomonas mucidolens TaxID=46679 RepID=A0A1H2NPR3_9PSED|nr:LysE family transporter [Pseudomonas mucidolens]SDV07348.1 Threonine/homoserine/homoserine lactone efflux protein [Pseudomonas mucidolens]SQH31379.1 LysE family transporter [Pseudomonas mucidolens]
MLLKGMLLGLAIAAPVGPIGLLSIQNTLRGGFKAGFITGMGAATADAVYAIAALFGLAGLLSLIGDTQYLRIAGAVFFIYLAWKTLEKKAEVIAAPSTAWHLWGMYTTTCLLTLSNPMTILGFVTLFAGLGVSQSNTETGLWLVLGVFLGSSLWWITLAGSCSLMLKRLSRRWLRGIDYACAVLLIGFALMLLYQVSRA